VYMREGATSRVMAADRLYGEFYDFCRVSPEYFGYHNVLTANAQRRKEVIFFIICFIYFDTLKIYSKYIYNYCH
jgi:hypothetical protein